MKSRIRKIIEENQLTATDFANAINIKKATVSHILSGRNKASLEVVQKILTTFSTLNSEWLLFGRGHMYKSESKESSSLLFPNESSKELTDNETIIDNKEEAEDNNQSKKNSEQDKKEDTEEKPKKKKKNKSKKEKKVNSEKKLYSSNKEIGNKSQKAEKIIILNSDNTFTEYIKSK